MKPQNLPAYRAVIEPTSPEPLPAQMICFTCDAGDVCTECDAFDWTCNVNDGFFCITKDSSP